MTDMLYDAAEKFLGVFVKIYEILFTGSTLTIPLSPIKITLDPFRITFDAFNSFDINLPPLFGFIMSTIVAVFIVRCLVGILRAVLEGTPFL